MYGLTGNIRFRSEISWRGKEKLILEVEEKQPGLLDSFCDRGPDFVVWRDAKTTDLKFVKT